MLAADPPGRPVTFVLAALAAFGLSNCPKDSPCTWQTLQIAIMQAIQPGIVYTCTPALSPAGCCPIALEINGKIQVLPVAFCKQ